MDRTAWGGEVLVGDAYSSENVGGLAAQLYTGGDLSARYAARPLIGLLRNSLDREELLRLTSGMPTSPTTQVTDETLEALLSASSKSVNTVTSSSTGRVLDAIAALLGICSYNSYDGECPMKLEAIARKTDVTIEAVMREENGRTVVDTSHLLQSIIGLRERGIRTGDIAFAAQWCIGASLAEIASQAAGEEGLKHVGFS